MFEKKYLAQSFIQQIFISYVCFIFQGVPGTRGKKGLKGRQVVQFLFPEVQLEQYNLIMCMFLTY